MVGSAHSLESSPEQPLDLPIPVLPSSRLPLPAERGAAPIRARLELAALNGGPADGARTPRGAYHARTFGFCAAFGTWRGWGHDLVRRVSRQGCAQPVGERTG